MRTAQQQATVIATKWMAHLNLTPGTGLDKKPERTRFILVGYTGTLASGFSARYFAADDSQVDSIYLGIFVEPWARKQPE